MAQKSSKSKNRQLLLVLGDQLNATISSLTQGQKSRDVVLMVEVDDEATYVRHHKKKIAFIFSAMRHFAESLREAGWSVDYVRLDDDDNTGSFGGEVARALKRHDGIGEIKVTEPGEWRVLEAMQGWEKDFSLPVEILVDDRFICSKAEFADWADGRKILRMEDFYREMRKKTGLLIDEDGRPAGGKWNFDSENRKPAKSDLFMPDVLKSGPDKITEQVLELVANRFGDHFGALRPFWFAVTRDNAEAAFRQFIADALDRFGDYQDAMLSGEPFLYHSVLSPYINAGLLDTLEVCRVVEKSYRDGDVPINAAEGFIRQVIGWREYVRGIYWLKMPEYGERNFFENRRRLPDFYWTGETKMACVKAVVEQTRQEAYAHHIQRLMITGNFALIAGIDPGEVHDWYLSVYADAYEWVELPNTLGMSQFADGGLLGSKPYAASANYINKMSDYCGTCSYKHTSRTSEDACPFNVLYWDFIARNEKKLSDNNRMKMIYGAWKKVDPDEKRSIRARARAFLDDVAPEK